MDRLDLRKWVSGLQILCGLPTTTEWPLDLGPPPPTVVQCTPTRSRSLPAQANSNHGAKRQEKPKARQYSESLPAPTATFPPSIDPFLATSPLEKDHTPDRGQVKEDEKVQERAQRKEQGQNIIETSNHTQHASRAIESTVRTPIAVHHPQSPNGNT